MKKLLAVLTALVLACSFVCAGAENNYAAEAQAYLEYIGTNLTNRNATAVGEEPEAGTTHAETVEWILAELKAAGYTDEQIEIGTGTATTRRGKEFPVKNITVTLAGKNDEKQVIVGAHYDGDGVGDNGSGVALMLSTACGLCGQQPVYTVKFVFFDCEEVGLLGAKLCAESLTEEEIAKTLYLVNIDAVAFGDYCNVYGGVQDDEAQVVTQTEAYDLAMAKAVALGMNTYTTADLDGYFAVNGVGPALDAKGLFSNPWTFANPAPMNDGIASPTTGDWSDHAYFKRLGITYLYMEATNWFAAGDGGYDAYTGYFETTDTTLGYDGMFMNTEFDTLENLNSFFPGRSLEHFEVFSPLLCSLVMNPLSAAPIAE